ncbi:uncharacterized protein VICG_00846 [Vittaforma corneae ATCC 50505]|uniref:Sm domain-containing protein n=1 Tax=Vittaforma corneae (strain ATCC 50505) TaxID=993615 RepID=L2GMT0_VITCO|nr:uncharacterized protein VICG_00846 [Vittaforma corneae ATCC 50505]ELA42203.1 hypothetical protein VICG_00846 [Vittaforma corneae ATCC 50505]
MYPLTLIRMSRGKVITMMLKDSQAVSGFLVKCDVAMNMHLQNATIQRKSGEKVFVKQCFLKGQNVKSVKIDPKILGKQHLFE